MLRLRIIACVIFGCVCVFDNAKAADVVVELQSGQLLRAQAIEPDPNSDGRVIVKVGNDRIQMQRSVNWKRVNRLAAPAEMLVDLGVPNHVALVDAAKLAREPEPSPRAVTNDSIPPAPASELPPQFFVAPDFVPILSSRVPFLDRDCWPIVRDPCHVCAYDPGVVIGIRDENPQACCSTNSLERIMAVPEPRELLVTSRPFNRYGLADWNSLEVSVQGRTADGLSCPVRGSFRCSLFVRRAWLVQTYGENYFEDARELVPLGQWSQFLDGSEADASGVQKVVFALPPQSPDHNLQLGSYGLLTAVLDIPGQGRLATSGPVTLRQFDPIRGRSVVDYGTSLLPSESVSEGLSPAGNWPAPLTNLRPDRRRFTIQP